MKPKQRRNPVEDAKYAIENRSYLQRFIDALADEYARQTLTASVKAVEAGQMRRDELRATALGMIIGYHFDNLGDMLELATNALETGNAHTTAAQLKKMKNGVQSDTAIVT